MSVQLTSEEPLLVHNDGTSDYTKWASYGESVQNRVLLRPMGAEEYLHEVKRSYRLPNGQNASRGRNKTTLILVHVCKLEIAFPALRNNTAGRGSGHAVRGAHGDREAPFQSESAKQKTVQYSLPWLAVMVDQAFEGSREN